MTSRNSPHRASAIAKGIRELYAAGQSDYSLDPLVLTDAQQSPIGRIADGETVIFCCRRGEREIQLTEAFTEAGFTGFTRPRLRELSFIILTRYHEKFVNLPVAFAPVKMTDTLGETISRAGLRQLHVAESEKFAHITFFLNGGSNLPFNGEEDVRIPSLKGIPFEHAPELSLEKVSEAVLAGIKEDYDLIAANFANGDVIGHTTSNKAKIRCAELVDRELKRVVEAARSAKAVVMITADHGNLEEMIHPDGSPHAAHTSNPVPFILVDPAWDGTVCLRDGKLADIAPTVLSALGIEQPAGMDGTPLTQRMTWKGRPKVLLIILDGWGLGREDASNPIHLGVTPFWDALVRDHPFCKLQAAGEAVGLQAGKAGNSEAGHLNIGAGRLVLQDDVRLEAAMQDGFFFSNEILCQTLQETRQKGGNLHLIGLLSEKSSHGSIDYPLALLKMAREHGLKEVYLHLIFDGRSTEPGSAPLMVEKLEKQMEVIGIGKIVSGIGRKYALDRDGDYARTQRAYEAFVAGIGKRCPLD